MTLQENNLISAIKKKKTEYELGKQALEKIILEKEAVKKSILEKEDKSKSYSNIVSATKLILEKLTSETKGRLEAFVTYGLKQIFPDRNYELNLILKEDSKRPGLDIALVENGVVQEITDAVGGGILSTVGLLFQIYYMEIYGLNKIMFMDESLAAVSKSDEADAESVNYLNNVLHFLNHLSKTRGYRFVIVTHENKVKDIADSVYYIKNGKVELNK